MGKSPFASINPTPINSQPGGVTAPTLVPRTSFSPLPAGDTPPQGFVPKDTPLGYSPDHFQQWRKDAAAPEAPQAKAANTAAQASTTSGDAKPCATCNTNEPYSLAFEVKDANGKLCNKMYYTVKLKIANQVLPGSTDENGLTERYFSTNPAEEIYLYLGHRVKEDEYPDDRDTEENKYDEAPLAHAKVHAVGEKYTESTATARLWKPWTTSDAEKDFIKNKIEEFRAHLYDLGDGGLTIGYGDFTPYKAGNKPNPEIDELRKKYPDDGPGISTEEASAKFDSNLEKKAKASSWNGDSSENSVNVPLYQREFDALISMRYNNSNTPYAGSGADPDTHKTFTGHTSVQAYLNRGRYTAAADRIPSSYNTVKGEYSKGVTNRRLSEKDTFTKDIRKHW